MTLKVLTSYIAQCDGPDPQTPCAHENTLTFHAFPENALGILTENQWTWTRPQNLGFLPLEAQQQFTNFHLHCYACTLLKQASEAPVGAFDPF